MNKLLRTTCTLMFAFLFIQMDALMSYSLLENADHKTLLILGEDHKMSHEILTTTFMGFLETIKMSTHTRPLACIVELPENEPLESMSLFSTNIKKILDADRLGTHRIKAIRYDERSDESSAIHIIIDHITEAIMIGVSLADLHRHYKTSETTASTSAESLSALGASSWEQLRKSIQRGQVQARTFLLTHTYLKVLDNELAKLAHLIEHHKDNKELAAVLGTAYQTFVQAHKKIHELLSKSPKNALLSTSIMNLFSTCKSVEERLTTFDTYYFLFIRDTDQVLADIFWINKTMSLLKVEPSVCVLVGHSHALSLVPYYLNLGFKIISRENMRRDSFPLLSTTAIDPNFGLKLLTQTRAFLKPLEACSIDGCCQKCFKVPEKLLRCGRCKEKSYCGADCQKSDWQTHKLSCKVKVESI